MRATTSLSLAATLAATLLLGGCASFNVHLTPAAHGVVAAYVDSVAGCTQVGTATVSVSDHIGPFARDNLTVRDELEVLARNAGAGLGANTVKPLGPPVNGQQQWGAYNCRGTLRRDGSANAPAAVPATPAAESTPLPPTGPAQTAPLRAEPLQIETVPAHPASPATPATAPWPAAGSSVGAPAQDR
ncbi:MAG: DUF4156 domain-containing protein [Metallibacterium scheffleri]|jgi:hypothetical protein|uniref:DUF4156 domain-containing protein n=1 Tax=Metallibacterium scheffleri TaxID=993689 RepID=UPI0026F02E6F|nr:DUF4156 domain-containing protein [Metallibacterium scheffleri]MCK9366607.1 DUF4156 domain-containing protein [Metallibacterium scheffleri]